jgi:alpha-tubulin suppressor-like RCC1 family protein
MNTSTLIQALCNKLLNTTTTSQAFSASQAVYKLDVGMVRTVASYVNLPDLSHTQPAQVFFVEDEEALYYAFGSVWKSITAQTSLQAWSWGLNTSGQLGDNSTVGKSSPVSVVGGFADWTDISAGSGHSLALRSNGSAWAWGGNSSGQLGDNSTVSKSSPVAVVGGFADWTDISAGNGHSLAVRSNGSAWAWGVNTSGRLGDNTTVGKSSPVSVVGGFADWTTVSAGGFHSLGTRVNGSAWAWGNNGQGQLGDNTLSTRLSPVSVVGGFSDWTVVSAGLATTVNTGHSLAVRSTGSLWGWGTNTLGQLGDNSTVRTVSPVSVVGGFSDWITVSAGVSHGLAIRNV